MDPLREWLIAVLVAVGGLVLLLLRAVLVRAVERATEEAITRRLQPDVLARELEKVRGIERQELRFTAYGQLWAALGPTAIYVDSTLDRATVRNLSQSLSTWYFTPTGGLFLTTPTRELYFTLQDLLRAVGSQPDWTAERPLAEPKDVFRDLLAEHGLRRAMALLGDLEPARLVAWPPADVLDRIHGWREDVEDLPRHWQRLSPEQRFCVVQQVASVLRTGLAADVESRLR